MKSRKKQDSNQREKETNIEVIVAEWSGSRTGGRRYLWRITISSPDSIRLILWNDDVDGSNAEITVLPPDANKLIGEDEVKTGDIIVNNAPGSLEVKLEEVPSLKGLRALKFRQQRVEKS
ncbi:hypothetical protein TNCV_2282041 [Trichonephila clavipes]|nr:hypothetical protein TNCV_2282041 [Trichonephila clavipes]